MRRGLVGRVVGGVTAALLAVAATAGSATATTLEARASEQYTATIVRDEFGVPHITAPDWGSLGFGQGYALSEDRACTVIDQIVKVRGERARWLGPGEDDEFIDSDFAYRHLGLWADAPSRWAGQSGRAQQVIDGYVAGFNAQIVDHELTGWCASEPWAAAHTQITTQDMYAYISDILLLASSRNLIQEIGQAQPPAAAASSTVAETVPATEPVGFAHSPLAITRPGASNGWALGADRSTTGGGLLLANPHFPWEGELRFWENHLTIPGELNVYGVGLTGLPGVQIGFNDAVAWTHTVSAGHRFTLYRYDLDPDDPTTYLVDGAPRQMSAQEYTIEVLGDDGDTAELTRTLYSTHHGPVLDVAPLGWTVDQAIAIRDGNIDTTGVIEQYLGMDAASSMDEFQAVHEANQGVPWVNTISTSDDGRAWFVDTSATPNLSPAAVAAWEAEVAAGGLLGLAYDTAGVVMLDGSDSLYDWVDDPASPAQGLVPYRQVPQLERRDYVFNANDSHWLTHPDELLTGYSPLSGAEGVPQSLRTRTNAMLLGETSEPWSLEDVQSAILSDRSGFVEDLLPALVEACRATPSVDLENGPVDLTAPCDVLANWDGTYTLNARGAILFREWNNSFEGSDRQGRGALFSDDFDPADPAGRPAVPVSDRTSWLEHLATAVQFLDSVGIPIDAPLGEWQFEVRTGDRIPIHGGTNSEGLANVVGCCSGTTSTGPIPPNGERVDDRSALTDLPGYPVSTGASFVMTLQFATEGPVAEGFLTYGNPDDPSDPAYRAGLEAFSAGEWRPLRFTPDEVAAIASGTAVDVTGERG